MKRFPLVATVLAILVCGTMIGLGLWQLKRADWKEGLIVEAASAQGKPPIAYPTIPYPKALPLYRKSSLFCLSVESWKTIGRRNVHGESGWSHLARCRTSAEGPGATVDIGWSRQPANPDWAGGAVNGIDPPTPHHPAPLPATASGPDTPVRRRTGAVLLGDGPSLE